MIHLDAQGQSQIYVPVPPFPLSAFVPVHLWIMLPSLWCSHRARVTHVPNTGGFSWTPHILAVVWVCTSSSPSQHFARNLTLVTHQR